MPTEVRTARGRVRSSVPLSGRSVPLWILAQLMSVTLAIAACGTLDGAREVSPDRRHASTAVTDHEVGHAALDMLTTLAGLPRAEVRITRAQDGGGRDVGAVGGDRPAALLAAIAADDVTRARGLQGVAELRSGIGMLFLFPEAAGPGGRPGFWMRDTLVPLDIVFARVVGDVGAAHEDGKGVAMVVAVATMGPCRAMPCPVTHPGVDFDLALEVAAGWLDTTGVAPGDALTWTRAVRP